MKNFYKSIFLQKNYFSLKLLFLVKRKVLFLTGYYSNITSTGNCIRSVSGQASSADIFVANRSDPAFVHVPYPEPGIWHLSVKALCLNTSADNLCECAEKCALNFTYCQMNPCPCAKECNAQIETSIASSPCVNGVCNSHGQCIINDKSAGFVFSSCYCTGGYRGFDCADDKYVLNKNRLLFTLLLLTTSNLAFLGAVYAAIRKGYYTEALVYAAAMFFSTFYHACESKDEVLLNIHPIFY